MIMTDWFPRTVLPVHVGCYSTKTYDMFLLKYVEKTFYWNGHGWTATDEHSEDYHYPEFWRGLLK